jgi:exopolysaccharide production protein ExoZ
VKPFLSIQYLRALAALAVVAFHSERAFPLGQAGVDIFFVISGFIMWMVTTKSTGPGVFLWHRLIRILPMYWVATLLMAAHQRAAPIDVLRSLLFWPYRDVHGQLWPVLVQGWTLNFEMFFYVVFAITLVMPWRIRLTALTGMLVILSAIGLRDQPQGAALHTYTSPLLIEFLAGVWVSALVQHRMVPGVRLAFALTALGVIGFLLSLGDYTPELWRFVVWGIPSTLIVLGAVSIETHVGMPSIRPFKLLGDSSYSIYLFHPFVVKTVARPLAQFVWPIPVAAVILAGGLIGIVAYYLLERPVTSWLRRGSAHSASSLRSGMPTELRPQDSGTVASGAVRISPPPYLS